jgi:ribonuclease HI
VANRAGLDRDQLMALVEDLQRFALRQQETVDRQSEAILRLQSRNGAGTTPVSQPTPRPTASPVPGSDFTIVFDGGAIGNPGRGYGSYQISGPDGIIAEQRLEYGDNVTNNQAEFLTLIHALEDLRNRLADAASHTPIAIRGDSQLVLNTIAGRWKARHSGLVPLHQQAVALLREFGRTDIQWQPRSKSVAVLGH